MLIQRYRGAYAAPMQTHIVTRIHSPMNRTRQWQTKKKTVMNRFNYAHLLRRFCYAITKTSAIIEERTLYLMHK